VLWLKGKQSVKAGQSQTQSMLKVVAIRGVPLHSAAVRTAVATRNKLQETRPAKGCGQNCTDLRRVSIPPEALPRH